MSNLTPEDNELLQRARSGLDATPDDQARVKGKLFAQIGIATGIGGAAVSTSTSATAGAGAAVAVAAGTSLVTKLLVVVAVVGVVGGGAAIVHRTTVQSNATPSRVSMPSAVEPTLPQAPPPIASIATPSLPHDDRPAFPAPTARPAPTATTATTSAAVATTPAATATSGTTATFGATATAGTATTGATVATPAPTPAVAPSTAISGPATVSAEAALLQNADAELKAGRADHALALLINIKRSFRMEFSSRSAKPNGSSSFARSDERRTLEMRPLPSCKHARGRH